MSDHVPFKRPASLQIKVPASQQPDRLDKVLAASLTQHSRNRLQSWIEAGHVHVNGSAARVRQTVRAGDLIEVWEQASEQALAFSPEPIALDVIACSKDWIVVNKPAGMVTHPGAGNWQGTLLNALLFHFPELKNVARAGIVHRLDKDTSGLLVVARHDQAQTQLVRQLQARSMAREYTAFVHGTLWGHATIDRSIGRDRRVPIKMSVDRPIAEKPAQTHYEARRHGRLYDDQDITEVVCRLETGRTHQIRVHLASISHPIVGDTLYGGRSGPLATRQMLHARRLQFFDVNAGQEVGFQAPWPEDFERLRQEAIWSD